MNYFVLLALPALTLAKINIDIVASTENEDQSINFYGNQVDIISDTEKNTFKLNDNNLKSAIRSYFGEWPDDAYLKSPTPWGDLYQSYGWGQVTRTLVPRSGKILQTSSQPVIVVQQTFINNSTNPATFNVGISQQVQNTVTSTWSTDGELSVGQDINYEFNFEIGKVGGSTKLSYTHSWGKSNSQSESITVGSSAGVEMVLQPGQSVVSELHATRGSMKVQMDYEASLSGDSAVNYSGTYKGHYFWGLGIRGIMSAGGLTNSVKSSEVLEVGFYSDSKIVVRDAESNSKLMLLSF